MLGDPYSTEARKTLQNIWAGQEVHKTGSTQNWFDQFSIKLVLCTDCTAKIFRSLPPTSVEEGRVVNAPEF